MSRPPIERRSPREVVIPTAVPIDRPKIDPRSVVAPAIATSSPADRPLLERREGITVPLPAPIKVSSGRMALLRSMEAQALKHHLSLDELASLLDVQGWRCPCGAGFNRQHHLLSPVIDHDHGCCSTTSCGQCVRGVLHSRCNLVLGQVGDTLSSTEKFSDWVTTYLKSP